MKTMNEFTYHFALKVRAYPNNRQKKIIFMNSRAKDFIYNKCVAIDKELFELSRVKIYCKPVQDRIDYLNSIRNNVRQIRNIAPFLSDDSISSDACSNAILSYQNAWNNYRKIPNMSMPVFRKRTNRYSFQSNPHHSNGYIKGAYFVDESHIVLPKVEKIRFKGDKNYIHRILSNTERCGTFNISLEPDGSCYISVQLASDTPFANPIEVKERPFGLDVNLKNLYTGTDGSVVGNPKYFYKSEQRLVKEQKKLSRQMEHAKIECPKGIKLHDFLSTRSEYQLQRKKVAHIQAHIKHQRSDYLNCVSKNIVKSHDIIVSEDIKVKNLLKNHRLSKSIQDTSWGELFRLTSIKARMYDRIYIKVPPQYTSQTCSMCGFVMKDGNKLSLNDREWRCPECGAYHDRDQNSAWNILNRGLATLA